MQRWCRKSRSWAEWKEVLQRILFKLLWYQLNEQVELNGTLTGTISSTCYVPLEINVMTEWHVMCFIFVMCFNASCFQTIAVLHFHSRGFPSGAFLLSKSWFGFLVLSYKMLFATFAQTTRGLRCKCLVLHFSQNKFFHSYWELEIIKISFCTNSAWSSC